MQMIDLDTSKDLKFTLPHAGSFKIAESMSTVSGKAFLCGVKDYSCSFDFAAWPYPPIAQFIMCVKGHVGLKVLPYEDMMKESSQPYGSMLLYLKGKDDVGAIFKESSIIAPFTMLHENDIVFLPFGTVPIATSFPESECDIGKEVKAKTGNLPCADISVLVAIPVFQDPPTSISVDAKHAHQDVPRGRVFDVQYLEDIPRLERVL